MTSDSTPTALLLIAFAVAPGICEEIAYRGFILAGFRRTGRVSLAIVLSSLAFGIVHMIPQQVFNATLLGLVLGVICVRSGSIIPSMAFHITFNSLEVLSHRLGEQLPTEGYFSRLWTFDPQQHGLVFSSSFTMFCAAVAGGLIYWFVKGNRNSAQELPFAGIPQVEHKATNPAS